jgi:hypothetical protein
MADISQNDIDRQVYEGNNAGINKICMINPYIAESKNDTPRSNQVSNLKEYLPKSIFFKSHTDQTVISENIQPTLRDLEELPIEDQIKYDKRSFSRYYKDIFIENQCFFNAFYYKSLRKPQFLRVQMLVVSQSLNFALNALFYSDDVIQAISKAKESNSSSFVFI